MPRVRTDADRLKAAEQLFSKAREELQGINLRTYRGRTEERDAIQEARNCADCGVDWTNDAIKLGDEHVVDLTDSRRLARTA